MRQNVGASKGVAVVGTRQDDGAVSGARLWLARRGVTAAVTDIVVARVALWRRIGWWQGLMVGLIIVGLLAWVIVNDKPSMGAAPMVVGYALAIGVMWWGLWARERGERAIASRAPRRVARAHDRSPAAVVGVWHLVAGGFSHLAALAVGAGFALAPTAPSDRAEAMLLLAATVLYAVPVWLSVHLTLRRPAVADTAGALAFDDWSRSYDARQALSPFLPLVGLIMAANAQSRPLMIALFGYAAACAVPYLIAYARHSSRRLASERGLS